MPRTADVYVEAIEIKMAEIGIGRIATLCGRYYAMDKNKHWERTARAFTMLVHSEGERAVGCCYMLSAIRFLRGIADEFISPDYSRRYGTGEPVAKIENGDVVIFFNHRADRMRQLVKALAVSDDTRNLPRYGKPAVSRRLS